MTLHLLVVFARIPARERSHLQRTSGQDALAEFLRHRNQFTRPVHFRNVDLNLLLKSRMRGAKRKPNKFVL